VSPFQDLFPLAFPVSFRPHFSLRFHLDPTTHSGFIQTLLLTPVLFRPYFSLRFHCSHFSLRFRSRSSPQVSDH
jgi:hypothetical protein